MGLFDSVFGTGEKKPAAGTPVVSKEQLIQNLFTLNRETAPFGVRPGQDEGTDLVAEWKIVDARWYQIFAKAGVKKVFRVLLYLDEAQHQVRSVDKEFSVSWEAGVPRLAAAAEYFRGQKKEFSFGTAIGFTEELKPGVIYNYKFETGEIKNPVIDVILAGGWSFKPVAFGSLK